MATALSGYLLVRLEAYLWGTSGSAGAFEVALSIPMFLLTASGFNVMQAVTAREFSALRAHSQDNISDYLSSFLNIFAIFALTISLPVVLFRGDIAALAGTGFGAAEQALTSDMILILTPLALLLGSSLFMGGVYAAFNIPITAEIGLLLTRFAAVAVALLLLAMGIGITPELLATILLLSAIASTLASYLLARRYLGFKYRLTLFYGRDIFKKVGPQVFAYTVVAILGQAIMIYYRSAFSLTAIELVAAFSYTFMICNLLATILGKVGFYVLTAPSQTKFEAGDLDEYRKIVFRHAFWIMLASVGFAVSLSVLDDVVITILFGGGNFDQHSHDTVRNLLEIFVFSVPALVLIWVFKLPSITGQAKLAAPLLDAAAWLILWLIVLVPAVHADPALMVWLMVVSFWVRVLGALAITLWQIRTRRFQLMASQGSGVELARQK